MGGEMGGRSEEGGIYVRIELIHFTVQQKLIQHFKAIMLQLKEKKRTYKVAVLKTRRDSSWEPNAHLHARAQKYQLLLSLL